MNEFVAKKLGEVLAFSRVGVETMERGKSALETIWETEDLQTTLDELKSHAARIEALTQMKDVTMTKAEGTTKKLQAMRDMYVGDEWDNPAELLEWSGFFQGAAVVHWALVLGAARQLELSELEELSEEAKDFHEDVLAGVSDALEDLGGKKAA